MDKEYAQGYVDEDREDWKFDNWKYGLYPPPITVQRPRYNI